MLRPPTALVAWSAFGTTIFALFDGNALAALGWLSAAYLWGREWAREKRPLPRPNASPTTPQPETRTPALR